MVAIKFLGLIVTFYLFVEAFGQNFYPARYGKRDENDPYRDKNLSENRRIGRSENQDVLNRKLGFFISGGRFGKRGCSENCFEEDPRTGSKEVISSGYQNRQDRSDRIRIPIRKNQFMIGSRFGKRTDGQTGGIGWRFGISFPGQQQQLSLRASDFAIATVEEPAENVNTQNLKCIFAGVTGFYRCWERRQFGNEEDAIESNFDAEFQ